MTAFEYSGGALCLDFANTWGNRADASSDRLGSVSDLLRWAAGAGIVTADERSELESRADRHDGHDRQVFAFALELREAIYRVCAAAAEGGPPAAEDVAVLNVALLSVPRQELCCGGACCEWRWPDGGTDLNRVLWPVVQSAAELITGTDVDRLRQCGAPDCNWLFMDRSRGGRRRWCDMSTCGNRAKARRYYRRHRGKP